MKRRSPSEGTIRGTLGMSMLEKRRECTGLCACNIGDIPAFTPAEAGPQFIDPEGCKAELTWVVVISQDSLPTENGHLSQK